MAGLTVAIDWFEVGAHQTVQCRHATVGIIGFIAPRLKRAHASVVAIMFVCAAKPIRSTTLSDIVLHFHLAVIYSRVFEQRGLTARRIVMSGNHSKLPYNLITAAYQGDVKTAIAQLAEGADVNARDCDGDTALVLAAERGHIELVKVLLKNGADVNAKNLNGVTALMRAAENNRAATVKILLAHHANCDAGDIVNCRPLMRAAYRGHVDVVKELLAYGADAKARNAFGNTAATLAARNGHSKIESMLREADDIGFVDSVRRKFRAARR